MQVTRAIEEADLVRICPVLLQLRPQYESADNLLQQIKLQQRTGYQLAFVQQADQVLCVAGFVIADKLAWHKHLYVDDLVTNEESRSTGAGKCMMDWLKDYAIQQGCQQLHLDSGVQRFAAHKFYLREGFAINSHHFSITDLESA